MKPAPVPFADSVRQHGCSAASAAQFAAASVELCTRFWVELDRLAATLALDDAQPTGFATRLQMLRLELLIVLDRCADRWMARLDHGQRAWLRSVMLDVLASLDGVDPWLPDHRSMSVAQNRLLSAILEQCADLESLHAVRGIPTFASRLAHERSARGGRSWAHF